MANSAVQDDTFIVRRQRKQEVTHMCEDLVKKMAATGFVVLIFCLWAMLVKLTLIVLAIHACP